MKIMLNAYFSDWKIWVYILLAIVTCYHLISVDAFMDNIYVMLLVIPIAPFFEWFVHKFILHLRIGKIYAIDKPNARLNSYKIGQDIQLEYDGKMLEAKIVAVEKNHLMVGTGIAKYSPTLYYFMQHLHYGHHINPNDLKLVFAPIWGGLFIIFSQFLLAYLVSGFNVEMALSFMFAVNVYYLFYEWVHLGHHVVEYIPFFPLGKMTKKAHTHHHFVDENLWWGITNPLGDIILQTYKNPEKVKKSPYTHDINHED